MRGYRTFILFTMHLLILTVVVISAYLFLQSSLTSPVNLQERRIFGKAVFGLVIWIELVLISFVAPALTSGAISNERERQTFDLLRVTLLPAHQLVLGKFLPGLAVLFLMLFTSIPIQAPAFLIGGVLWQEILLATLLLCVTAVAFCALGILLSSLIRRTLIATSVSYAITIFLVFGIPIVAILLLIMFGSAFPSGFSDLSSASERILVFIGWFIVSITPIGAMVGTELAFVDQQTLFLIEIDMSNQQIVAVPAPWIPYVMLYFSFSLVAIWLSIQLIKQSD